MIKKKIKLEISLQDIPIHPNPQVELEQYSTPAVIAADLLWNAKQLGDVVGRNIVDLGCGTGILAIGAALLGAREVVGIDVDPVAVEVAQKQAYKKKVEDRTWFISGDVKHFRGKADTVIQNPPFGAQKSNQEADRVFMSKALKIAPVVYSFHMKETENFVEKYFLNAGGKITHRYYYPFTIPHIYEFHKKEKVEVDVVVVRVERTQSSI